MTTSDFGKFMDHFAGRTSRREPAGIDSALAVQAQRLVEAGRRALSAPTLGKRARNRALRIFRDHQRAAAPRASILQLVLDSLSLPTPALRHGGRPPVRFLKFEGEIVVELQVKPAGRTFELRGQVTAETPPTSARLDAAGKQRTCKVAGDGTFVFRSVPHGSIALTVLGSRIEIDL